MSGVAFEPRTAISILLDEAAPEVAAARYELDPAARPRIALHVTLLFPFVPRREASRELVAELRDFFGERPRPKFELARVEAFPEVVSYAAPEPADGLATLIRQLTARYPETPPYGGAFADSAAFNKRMKSLWIGVGTAEPDMFRTSIGGAVDALKSAGVRVVYFESSGTSHEWQTWRRSLNDLAPRLFR